jgi:hypothetical protein
MSHSVSVTVSVPPLFYDLLKICADCRGATPEDVTRDALIRWIDVELQDGLDEKLEICRQPGEWDYEDQLRALFGKEDRGKKA